MNAPAQCSAWIWSQVGLNSKSVGFPHSYRITKVSLAKRKPANLPFKARQNTELNSRNRSPCPTAGSRQGWGGDFSSLSLVGYHHGLPTNGLHKIQVWGGRPFHGTCFYVFSIKFRKCYSEEKKKTVFLFSPLESILQCWQDI